MEICKAPTLRLKALNKHTHIMYIEMENVINLFFIFYISTSVNVLTSTESIRLIRDGEKGERVWRWGGGGEGDYIPIATLSQSE